MLFGTATFHIDGNDYVFYLIAQENVHSYAWIVYVLGIFGMLLMSVLIKKKKNGKSVIKNRHLNFYG